MAKRLYPQIDDFPFSTIGKEKEMVVEKKGKET